MFACQTGAAFAFSAGRMETTHERVLIAAQGYSELDMHECALAELARLPAALQHDAMVVETHLSIYMQARRFAEALPFGQELCRMRPEVPVGFIHAAFCFHELGKTREARELLISGPPALKAEATYHYNLACYEATLGNLEEARAYLATSFSLDRKLKDHAREDPDLRVLRDKGLALG